jgi:hypothetical protein
VNSRSRCEPEFDAQAHIGVWDWRRCKAVAQSGWRRSFWLEFSWSPQAGFTHRYESFEESVFFYFSPKAVLFQKKHKLFFLQKKVQFSFSFLKCHRFWKYKVQLFLFFFFFTWNELGFESVFFFLFWNDISFQKSSSFFLKWHRCFIYYGIFFAMHKLKAKCENSE